MIAQLDPLYVKLRPRKTLVRLLSHSAFQGRFLTTRCRYLNFFILNWLHLLKCLPEIRPVKNPIFIIGMGRSGTTILGKILSLHPHVGFINEAKAVWYSIDPRADIHGHFSSGEAVYSLSEKHVNKNISRSARNIFSWYLALTGSTRLLDKNPELIFRIDYIRRIFPGARFIFIVRNGWDTISSIMKWNQENHRESHGIHEDWWGRNHRKWQYLTEQLVPDEPLLSGDCERVTRLKRIEDRAAVEWILTMQQGKRVLEKGADFLIKLHFEHLIRSPGEELSRILTFCGLPEDSVVIHYGENILSSLPAKQPRELSEVLRPAFQETMATYGYQFQRKL